MSLATSLRNPPQKFFVIHHVRVVGFAKNATGFSANAFTCSLFGGDIKYGYNVSLWVFPPLLEGELRAIYVSLWGSFVSSFCWICCTVFFLRDE